MNERAVSRLIKCGRRRSFFVSNLTSDLAEKGRHRVRREILYKEYLITCTVSIITLSLAYHVKEKHTKNWSVDEVFDIAPIIVAEIFNAQFLVFPNLSRSLGHIVRHSSTILLSSFFKEYIFPAYTSTSMVPSKKVAGRQVRRSVGSIYGDLPPNTVVVAFSVQIST